MGLGPKAFVVLDGRTLLERAVTTMLAVAARVTVAVPPTGLERAQNLLKGHSIHFIEGGGRRIDTLRALVNASRGPWLLLHDVVHPFVTTTLSQRVIEEARRTGAAAAALSNADFLYGRDGILRAAPNDVVAIQKPVAFRNTDIARGFAMADLNAAGGPISDASVLEILALGDQRTSFVAGHAMNGKLTLPEDFELARLLVTNVQ